MDLLDLTLGIAALKHRSKESKKCRTLFLGLFRGSLGIGDLWWEYVITQKFHDRIKRVFRTGRRAFFLNLSQFSPLYYKVWILMLIDIAGPHSETIHAATTKNLTWSDKLDLRLNVSGSIGRLAASYFGRISNNISQSSWKKKWTNKIQTACSLAWCLNVWMHFKANFRGNTSDINLLPPLLQCIA